MHIVENVSFKLEKDHWQNYKLFDETELKTNNKLVPKSIN